MDKPKSKFSVRYSEAFKRQVCEEYLQGGQSKNSIERKYKIGHNQVKTWLEKYNYPASPDTVENKEKAVVSHSLTFGALNTNEPKSDQLTLLQQELAQLKKELEMAKIQVEGYELMLELAEKEFKLPIRKKSDTK